MIRESDLDNIQHRVLNATLDKSFIVRGCAGSGKSVLALIKAQHIEKVLGASSSQVVVYTKALSRYMNLGKETLKLKQSFTYHWYWANIQQSPSSDYVIVDEIQDFVETEVRQFIAASKKCFFFFGDTAQSIYQPFKNAPIVALESIPSLLSDGVKLQEYELYYNYRLPLAIAQFVQHIGVDLPDFSPKMYKSPETSMPHLLSYARVSEQLKAIKRIVDSMKLTDVAILLPSNDIVLEVYNALRALGLDCEVKYNAPANQGGQNIDTLNFTTDNPKVMTYHSAKGLQFETVFIPLLESCETMDNNQRKALYVAMTRTYRSLYLMYSGSMPSILANIPSDQYEVIEVDTVEDI